MIRGGAASAVVAGACWVIKAVGILLTGAQPPLVFEAAFVLFPLALVGLYAAIRGRGGRLALCGLVLAVAAEVSAVVVRLGELIGPAEWVPEEDTVTILTPFIVLGGFGTFVALLLLGIAVRQTRALPGAWRSFPLSLAVAAVPLMVVGGVLEPFSERLLEIPIVILGVAWIALGVVLARHASVYQTSPVES